MRYSHKRRETEAAKRAGQTLPTPKIVTRPEREEAIPREPTTANPQVYVRAVERIARMRKGIEAGASVSVVTTIDGRRATYQGVVVKRLPSSRYRVQIELLGKTYLIITDPSNVSERSEWK